MLLPEQRLHRPVGARFANDPDGQSLSEGAIMGRRFAILCAFVVSITTAVDVAHCAEFDRNMHSSWFNQPCVVLLKDGRTPRGLMSSNTGITHLVLRRDEPGISLESRFRWDLVEGVRPLSTSDQSGPSLPPAPAESIVPPRLSAPEITPVSSKAGEPLVPSARLVQLDPLPVSGQGSVIPDLNFAPEVRSLNIQATTANWDRDAEMDGLMVRVSPLDTWGQVVPMEGRLDLELIGESVDSLGGQPSDHFDSFGTLEKWTVPVLLSRFDPAGVVIRVPFRRFHPERQLDLAQLGFLFARLSVPGIGRFDAVDSQVVLRPSNRFRDDLQLRNQMRQFPFERGNSSVGYLPQSSALRIQ